MPVNRTSNVDYCIKGLYTITFMQYSEEQMQHIAHNYLFRHKRFIISAKVYKIPKLNNSQ